MRRELAKKSKSWLKILKNNNFRSPYQILVDSSFINIMNKLSLSTSILISLFRSEPKFFMTKCTYQIHKKSLKSKLEKAEANNTENTESTNQESKVKNKKDFSANCEIVNCQHEIPSKECAYGFIKEDNPHHYILASHNLFYLKKMRDSKKIPVLRIDKSVPKINCNMLSTEQKKAHESTAAKGELKRLKKMFG